MQAEIVVLCTKQLPREPKAGDIPGFGSLMVSKATIGSPGAGVWRGLVGGAANWNTSAKVGLTLVCQGLTRSHETYGV